MIVRIFFAISLAVATVAPSQDAPVPGNAVVARVIGDAVILWDATPEIAAIVRARLSDADANSRLAHESLRLLRANLRVIAHAKTITVRILYQKTGSVSPLYGTGALLGTERYAELHMRLKDALGNRDNWKHLKYEDALPKWVIFKITGGLPPR